MVHFRQEALLEKHYSTENIESFTHTYKGKEYEIIKGAEKNLPPEVLQSVATRLRNKYPPENKTLVQGEGLSEPADIDSEDPGTNKAPGFNQVKNEYITKKELIRKELLRLSRVEYFIEEKLDYPRVFKKLLSEPHLALYERKKTLEVKQDLYLFIDSSIGYNPNDKGFHFTMFRQAQKIKGIKVFYTSGLRISTKSGHYYYWDYVKKYVPKGSTILAFSQGCGGTYYSTKIPPGYNFYYVTHFRHGDNCGCSTIRYHEDQKNLKNIFYGIDDPSKLKLVNLE